MTYLTVNVTSDDIKNGVRKDPRCCPIARAVNRTLDIEDGVEVYEFYIQTDDYTITGYGDIHREIYALPKNAVEFICDFDSSKPVEPFEFTAQRIS